MATQTRKTPAPRTEPEVKDTSVAQPIAREESIFAQQIPPIRALADMGFYERLLLAQSELIGITRTGVNSHQNYKYVKESDLIESIRPILNKWGLFLTTECCSHSIERFEATVETNNKTIVKLIRAATVEVRCEIIDIFSDQRLSRTMPGYAEDAQDKALYKAITGATKYAIWKTLGLSTADDPEGTPTNNGAGTRNQGNYRSKPQRGSVPGESSPGHLPSKPNQDLINRSTDLLQEIGWTNTEGRTYLQSQYGKQSRSNLTEAELLDFIAQLEALKN